ncbi:MAG: hypothetical protein FWB96_00730 [Defluviitaleaceae bacterium]|nr:hypothetical protein [Defluviitaleaceae bacterium]MCL2262734.1 hypothetical protein [Defluviitaleaceae bacterium]
MKNIKERALQLGYSTCGIIPAEALDGYAEQVSNSIKSFPNSAEMYERLYRRIVLSEPKKSIIVCARGYGHYKVPVSLRGRFGKFYLFHGHIEYSDAYRAKQEFTDYLQGIGLRIIKSAPPARWVAAKAGIGQFGWNNFIYTQEHGSYVALDTWVIDGELEYDTPSENHISHNCNDSFRKCIKACPTNALSDSLKVDWGKCITHLMYRDDVSGLEQKQMGQWLYGCDVCQDVCPMNRGKLTQHTDFPRLAEYEQHLTLEAILTMGEDTYTNIVYPRFWFAGKNGLSTWKRNAQRATENLT